MNKKILFILLTITIITSLGILSAADTNNTQTPDTQTNTIQESQEPITKQATEPTKTINKTTTKNTKKASESINTYDELYNNLTNPEAEEEMTISLDTQGDEYVVSQPITLSEAIKKLVINGNHKLINGHQNRFLTVNHICNITFNNIQISYCKSNQDGSAIYQNGGSLTLYNSSIGFNGVDSENPEAFGGVVATNATELTIIDTSFYYNDVNSINDSFGGAVSFNGQNKTNINIINSRFDRNGHVMERIYGSAVSILKPNNTNIINSYFGFNKGYDGVAIYYDSHLNDTLFRVENSTFENNTCSEYYTTYDGYGGAILAYTNSPIIINKSKFISNMAKYGGAIKVVGGSGNNIDIIDSYFDSNGMVEITGRVEYIDYALKGGALDIESAGNTSIINTTFKNNKAAEEGAAILYYGGNTSILKIKNSTFNSNGIDEIFWSSYGPQITNLGGAISITDYNTTIIDDVKFLNNKAKESGALYYKIGSNDSDVKLIINNTIFRSNGITNSNNAGALTIDEADTAIIENTQFKQNNGLLGAAYILDPRELLIKNTTFDMNTAYNSSEEAQATAGGLTLISDGNNTIINSTFTNNNGMDGGAIDYLGLADSNLYIIDSKFESNSDTENNTDPYVYTHSNGGALNIESFNNVSIQNTTFKDNSADMGGAIQYVNYADSILEIRDSLFDSNGIKDLTKYATGNIIGGALALSSVEGKNTFILDNTNFTDNIAPIAGAIYVESHNESDVFINNSRFDSNSIEYDANQYTISALAFLTPENVIINNSVFNNHVSGGMDTVEPDTYIQFYLSGLIISEMETEDNFTVANTNFTNNKGVATTGLTLIRGNAYVENTIFENNTMLDGTEEFDMIGILINSMDTLLNINNITVKNNGIPEESATEYSLITSLPLILQKGKNITINNSNFLSNIGINQGIPVAYDSKPAFEQFESQYEPVASNVIVVTNSRFEDNKNYAKPMYGYVTNIAPGILILAGNARVNNTQFVSNKVIQLETEGYPMENLGVISCPINGQYLYLSCNVTNCLFYDNTPANYILDGNKIIMNNYTSEGYEQQKSYLGYYSIYMDDLYMPTRANVTVYVDDETSGTQYQLISTKEEPQEGPTHQSIYDLEIEGLTLDLNRYMYKLVINQTEESLYYDDGYHQLTFNNNTYYFLIPHEYITSINATSPVKVGDNTTIKGKVYYNDHEGQEKVLKNKSIDLYINDTYITTTQTDTEGIYEFNYTANVIGTQNVTIKLNDEILPGISNNTTFDVNHRPTTLNINTTDSKHGKPVNITFTLTETDNTPVSGAQITVTLNNQEYNITTKEDGTYTMEYTPETVGNNYLIATYPGNYSYAPVNNKTTFKTIQQNTTLTITATNTTINNKTLITATLKDEEENPIPNTQITIYINDKPINKETNTEGTVTLEYTTTTPGENYVEAYYKGNENYTSSINSTIYNAEKINTTTTATPLTQKAGNTTINIKVEGQDKNKINNGTITITDKNGNPIMTSTITGEETPITITNTTIGTYNITITYNGNETYNPSNTTTTLTIKTQPKIDIKILNTTTGNVEAEIIVTDETGKAIPEQTVTITLPDGIKTNKTTDQDGKIQVKDTTTPTGNSNITVTVPDSTGIIGTNKTEQFTITPDYQKIIDQMNETINQLNNTVQEQNKTIQNITEENKNLTKQLEQAQNKIQNLTEELEQAQNKIQNLTEELEQAQNKIQNLTEENKNLTQQLEQAQDKIQNLTEENKNLTQQLEEAQNKITQLNNEIQELKDTLDTLNKTSVITAIPENRTVDDNKVTVTLNYKLGTPISNAPITIKNSKGETIATGKTDKNGIAVIPVNTKAGTENITVTYPGTEKQTPSTTTVSITTTKNKVTVTVDPINGIIGEDITLTAHITDKEGNPVNGGNLVFKLNGKTLRNDGSFNSTAPAMKLNVKNGLATITIKADLYLRNTKNITASYSGTYKYEEAKANTVTAQIKKREAKITLTATPTKQKQYNTITFTAKLEDTTPNTKNKTAINTNNKVIFKINGVTIKDKNNKNLEEKVTNSTATYKYTVPQGMGGVTSEGDTRNYEASCVLISENYYPDTRDDTIFNVERSPTTIQISRVSVNTKNQLSIKAILKDYKGNKLIGDSTVNIKINGKSYVNPKTNKQENFKVTGGVINLSNLELKSGITVKSVTIVTGDRQAYLGQRNTTTNIVKA